MDIASATTGSRFTLPSTLPRVTQLRPIATAQLLPEAGAQRLLEAVRCRGVFGSVWAQDWAYSPICASIGGQWSCHGATAS
jgi:hypothetical protein